MNSRQLSLLDNIRLSNGPECLKNYCRELFRLDRSRAMEQVNDQNIQFNTLYFLKEELQKEGCYESLNPLYRKALDIADELSGEISSKTEKRMRTSGGNTVSALGWILRTGFAENNADDKYEQLMERCAALLVKSFNDATILPVLAEMIFARNRRGALIHELVWAFFEARRPDSLLLIARRLTSPVSHDVKLAKKLLCFVPEIANSDGHTGTMLYTAMLNWLSENMPFLYYTGESLHLCGMPLHYSVSIPAKYLCRPVSTDTGKPLMPLDASERELLSRFKSLPEAQQIKLSEFSWLLYRKNIHQWNVWIRYPIERQAVMASQMMGGLK